MTKISWRKRFDKLKLCKCPNGNFCFDTAFVLKHFISQELKRERKNIPMGVSQWLNHGEKFGYAEWWKKEIREEMGKVLRMETLEFKKEWFEKLKLRQTDCEEFRRIVVGFNDAVYKINHAIDNYLKEREK